MRPGVSTALTLPPELARKFLLLKLSLGMPAPNDPKLREELTQVAASLSGSYGKGKYCPGGHKEPCHGIDDLEEQMGKSAIRTSWPRSGRAGIKVGAPMRDRYARFVELSNQGRPRTWLRGYRSALASRLRHDARSSSPPRLERLWKQVEPLYQELHAYYAAQADCRSMERPRNVRTA